jgi:tetratricopeptide (TPR) repeat protein
MQAAVTQLLAADRAEEAARQLDEWLRVHPDDGDALYLRAIAAQKGGNVAAALICLNRAQLLRPEAEQDSDVASPWNQLSAALGAALLAHEAAASGTPPAWTWPLAAGMASLVPREELLPAKPSIAEIGRVVPSSELGESAILQDAHGQWAEAAKASSEYGSDSYGPVQATGAPNVPGYADDSRAWASASADNQEEWLELTYTRAVHATDVRIRQTFNPGAIKQVEIFDASGQPHVIWSGIDPARAAPPQIAWFSVKIAAPTFVTQRVRIVLDSPAVKGWNEIDAVQLVGE